MKRIHRNSSKRASRGTVSLPSKRVVVFTGIFSLEGSRPIYQVTNEHPIEAHITASSVASDGQVHLYLRNTMHNINTVEIRWMGTKLTFGAKGGLKLAAENVVILPTLKGLTVQTDFVSHLLVNYTTLADLRLECVGELPPFNKQETEAVAFEKDFSAIRAKILADRM